MNYAALGIADTDRIMLGSLAAKPVKHGSGALLSALAQMQDTRQFALGHELAKR